MAPRQVILGGDDEPYAVQTDLGWSIVVCLSQSYDSPSSSRLGHKISMKELPPVTPADAIRILESDFKDGSEDIKTVSQDDITFLNKLDEAYRKTNMAITKCLYPSKTDPVCLTTKTLSP